MVLRFSPFAISLTITSLLFINLCNAIFRCGCRALWNGADVACNVHAPHQHHCPWCAHGVAGYAIVFILMCLPQLAISLTRWSWAVRLAAAIAAFPIAGFAIALVSGWVDSYWTR